MGRINRFILIIVFLLLSAPLAAQTLSTAPRFEKNENPTYPSDRGTFILSYDGEPETAVGISGGGEFTAAARFPGEMLALYQGFKIYKMFVYFYDVPQTIEVRIYKGGNFSAPGDMVYSQPVPENTIVPNDWNTIFLTEPVEISNDTYWAGVYTASEFDYFPVGIDGGPANTNGGYTEFDGNWLKLTDFGIPANYNIKVGLSDNPGGEILFPTNPSPANFATNVAAPENELSWTNPPNISATRLYFSNNFNAVLNEDPSTIVSDGFGQDFVFNNFLANQLEYNTQYYWKVSVQKNDGSIISGLNWTFTTQPETGDSNITFIQIIHNAADPVLEFVDVYINGALAAEDVAFRNASPKIMLEANQSITISLAPPNTGINSAVAQSSFLPEPGMEYTIVASGVLNPFQFSPNPNGRNIGIHLFISSHPDFGDLPGLVTLQAFHGVTDAPGVNLVSTDNSINFQQLKFGDYSGIQIIPSSFPQISVIPAGSNTPLVTYDLPLGYFDNQTVTLFASGFLNPLQPQDPSFGLYAAMENGFVMELQPIGQPGETAKVQLIHNSPDVELQTVKVWLNGDVILNEFNFRDATPYLELPTNDSLVVGVGFPSEVEPRASFPLLLQPNQNYVAIVNGVYSVGDYTSNPDGKNISLNVNIKTNAELAGIPGTTRLFVAHGATDAPAVDVLARDSVQLVDNLFYGDLTDYLNVPSQDYILDVTLAGDNSAVVASYFAPLSQLEGTSAVVFASGFLNPALNQNGEPFGLFAALPSGYVIALPTENNPDELAVSLPGVNFNYSSNNTEIEIPVTVSNLTNEDIIAYQFTVLYDQQYLTATGTNTSGTLSDDNWTVFENIQEPGKIVIGAFGTSEIAGNGTLVKLKFNVNGTAGITPLTFEDFVFNSGNPQPILQDGFVNILLGLCGDANEDQNVFAEDAALTAQHAIGLITLTPGGEQNADVDFSNDVTAFDAALILRSVIGLPLPVATCFDGNSTDGADDLPGGMVLAFEPFAYSDLGNEVEVSYKLSGMNAAGIISFQFEIEGLNETASISMLGEESGNMVYSHRTGNKFKSAIVNAENLTGESIGFKIRMSKDNPVDNMVIKNILANNYEGEDLVITNIEDDVAITDYNLVGAYPNPFNPSTNIVFQLPERNMVTLEVYDILGRKIKTLFNGEADAGKVEIKWNGDNEFGNRVATGNYIVLMRSENFIKSMKINLLK